jgi:hypothetical protein
MLLLVVCLWKINVIIIIIIFRRGRVGPLKAVVKLFKVRKIGAKLIFFLSNIDSPYQRYAESTTPRITDVSVMQGVDGATYIRGFFQKLFRRGRGCLHLSVCYGKGDRNESTNISISKLIIGTKPKRFDLVRLLSEQKQNVSICSKII